MLINDIQLGSLFRGINYVIKLQNIFVIIIVDFKHLKGPIRKVFLMVLRLFDLPLWHFWLIFVAWHLEIGLMVVILVGILIVSVYLLGWIPASVATKTLIFLFDYFGYLVFHRTHWKSKLLLLDLHLVLLFLPQLFTLLQFLLLLFKIKDLYRRIPVLLSRLIERVDFSLLRVHDVNKLVVMAPIDEALVLIVLPVPQPFMTHLFFHLTSAVFERVIFLKDKIQSLHFAQVFHLKPCFLSRLSCKGSLSGQILWAIFTVKNLTIKIHLLFLFSGDFVFCVHDTISILLIGLYFLHGYLIFELLNMRSYGLLVTKLDKPLNMTLLYLYGIKNVNICIDYRNFVPIFKFLLSLERCKIMHLSQYVRRRMRKLLH